MLRPKLHLIPGQSQWLEVKLEEPLHHPLSIRACTSCFSEEDLDVATELAAITIVGAFMKIQRTTIRMEIETVGAMLKFLVDECKGKWSIYCYIYDSTHFNNLDTARKWVVSKWIFFWLYNDTNVNVEMLPCWTRLKLRKVPCNQNDGFHILDVLEISSLPYFMISQKFVSLVDYI